MQELTKKQKLRKQELKPKIKLRIILGRSSSSSCRNPNSLLARQAQRSSAHYHHQLRKTYPWQQCLWWHQIDFTSEAYFCRCGASHLRHCLPLAPSSRRTAHLQYR